MKKLIILLLATAVLSSCSPSYKVLYWWGGTSNGTTAYEDLTYQHYKTQSPESVCKLLCLYENMIINAAGSRQVPPPGVCAEYGYLLLQPDTAIYFNEKATNNQKKIFERADYGLFFSERGREMLQKEIELYPESRKFIEPLMKKFAR